MKRETTMAFLAGVAVTGAFFAGMGATQQASRPKILGFQIVEESNAIGGKELTPYLMTEAGEVWRWYRPSQPNLPSSNGWEKLAKAP